MTKPMFYDTTALIIDYRKRIKEPFDLPNEFVQRMKQGGNKNLFMVCRLGASQIRLFPTDFSQILCIRLILGKVDGRFLQNLSFVFMDYRLRIVHTDGFVTYKGQKGKVTDVYEVFVGVTEEKVKITSNLINDLEKLTGVKTVEFQMITVTPLDSD